MKDKDKCLRCGCYLGVKRSTFCSQTCRGKWVKESAGKSKNGTGIWVKIDEKTHVYVRNPENVEKVVERYRNIRQGVMEPKKGRPISKRNNKEDDIIEDIIPTGDDFVLIPKNEP